MIDKLIGALCSYLKRKNYLKGNGCVATVMSNKALEDYLNQTKLAYLEDVGDKYVLKLWKKKV